MLLSFRLKSTVRKLAKSSQFKEAHCLYDNFVFNYSVFCKDHKAKGSVQCAGEVPLYVSHQIRQYVLKIIKHVTSIAPLYWETLMSTHIWMKTFYIYILLESYSVEVILHNLKTSAWSINCHEQQVVFQSLKTTYN